LLPIPSFGGRRRLRVWEVGDDGLLLVFREESARVWVVGEVKEGVNAAEDGRDAFAVRVKKRRSVSLVRESTGLGIRD
jgi:hypothetical protein